MDKILKNKKLIIIVGLIIAVVIAVVAVQSVKKTPAEKLSELLSSDSATDYSESQYTKADLTQSATATTFDEEVSVADIDRLAAYTPSVTRIEKIESEKFDLEVFVAGDSLYCRNMEGKSEPVVILEGIKVDEESSELEDDITVFKGEKPWIIYCSANGEMCKYDFKNGEKTTLFFTDDNGIHSEEFVVSSDGKTISYEFEDYLCVLYNGKVNQVVGREIERWYTSADGSALLYADNSGNWYYKNSYYDAVEVSLPEDAFIEDYTDELSEVYYTRQIESENEEYTDSLFKSDLNGNEVLLNDDVQLFSIADIKDGKAYELELTDETVKVGEWDKNLNNLVCHDGVNSTVVLENVIEVDYAYETEELYIADKNGVIYTVDNTKVEKKFETGALIAELTAFADRLYYSVYENKKELLYKIDMKSKEGKPVLLSDNVYAEKYLFDDSLVYKNIQGNALYENDKLICENATVHEIQNDCIYYSLPGSKMIYRYKNGESKLIFSEEIIILRYN